MVKWFGQIYAINNWKAITLELAAGAAILKTRFTDVTLSLSLFKTRKSCKSQTFFSLRSFDVILVLQMLGTLIYKVDKKYLEDLNGCGNRGEVILRQLGKLFTIPAFWIWCSDPDPFILPMKDFFWGFKLLVNFK